LQGRQGPVIAASDYMKGYLEQLRAFVPAPYTVLGTDGFGRSDTRQKLRHFFEVDRNFIVLAALNALMDEGLLDQSVVAEAMKSFGIHGDKPDPMSC
ncbi:MAG: pyruvate dehydrogenase (acetyl-transferring), homodimeric type, partial [Pseudomonadota bacterium]